MSFNGAGVEVAMDNSADANVSLPSSSSRNSALNYASATLPIRRALPVCTTVNQLHGFRRNSSAQINGASINADDISVAITTSSSPKLNNNRESEIQDKKQHEKHSHNLLMNGGADSEKPLPFPKFKPPPTSVTMSEMLTDPVDETANDLTTWEYQTVSLSRVSGFGFGIAVSGGKDNPHFKSGDPSIVISDVLKAGPAWGVLHINDRIICANAVSLENVEYATAVRIMKESEHLNMIIKRRVPIPVVDFEQRTLKFTLSKSKNKDDFGIILGCKFYIKEIVNPKLVEREPCPKEGDIVLKINGSNADGLSLNDAQKLLDKSKERLALVIQRDVPRGSAKWSSQTTLYERFPDTPLHLHSPHVDSSIMVSSMYSNDGESPLNNGVGCSSGSRMNGVVKCNRLAVSEYTPSQSSSRSRTPNLNCHDETSTAFPMLHHSPALRSLSDVNNGSASSTIVCDTRTLPNMKHATFSSGGGSASPPDTRQVSFSKHGGSVGIRVIGGDDVGIFISAVQPNSPASSQGVRPGDQLLKVNGKDMKGITREDAVLYLLGLQDHVELRLHHRRDEFDRIRMQNLGDNFFVRVHFDYLKPENGELAFRRGDIFQVIDTLYGGTVGSWQVVKFTPGGSSSVLMASGYSTESPSLLNKGIIPNAARAQMLMHGETLSNKSESKLGGTLFRRRKASSNSSNGSAVTNGRRSKSLTKGHWDEVIFGSGGLPSQPAYERVKLKHVGFFRPIVLFGALADIAREQLLQDFPLRFAPAGTESDSVSISKMTMSTTSLKKDEKKKSCTSGIIRLSSIKDIVKKNKHCVLDVTPGSVEKLNYAQCYPIVIFLQVDSRSRLLDLRKKFSKAATKNTRKLMEQASEIQKHYRYLFSAVLDATHEEWFDHLRELIGHLQERRVWVSETHPTQTTDDDFLFPMSPGIRRYSSSNGAADSDTDSLRADYASELGVCNQKQQINAAGDYGLQCNSNYASNISASMAMMNGHVDQNDSAMSLASSSNGPVLLRQNRPPPLVMSTNYSNDSTRSSGNSTASSSITNNRYSPGPYHRHQVVPLPSCSPATSNLMTTSMYDHRFESLTSAENVIHENLMHGSMTNGKVPYQRPLPPPPTSAHQNMQQNGDAASFTVETHSSSNCVPLYENRATLAEYISKPSCLASAERPRMKPRPPPRLGSHPPVPPKPKLVAPASASTQQQLLNSAASERRESVSSNHSSSLSTSLPSHSDDAVASNGIEKVDLNRASKAQLFSETPQLSTAINSCHYVKTPPLRSCVMNAAIASSNDGLSYSPSKTTNCNGNGAPVAINNGPVLANRGGRHYSEPGVGMYDVKQILASHCASPPITSAPQPQQNGMVYPYNNNCMSPPGVPRARFQSAVNSNYVTTSIQPVYRDVRNRPFSPTITSPHLASCSQQFVYPPALQNHNTQYDSSPNPVLRTSSMPASTAYHIQTNRDQERTGSRSSGLNSNGFNDCLAQQQQQSQVNIVQYGQLKNGAPIVAPKSAVPPPAPKSPVTSAFLSGNCSSSVNGCSRSDVFPPSTRANRHGPELVPVNFPSNILDCSTPTDSITEDVAPSLPFDGGKHSLQNGATNGEMIRPAPVVFNPLVKSANSIQTSARLALPESFSVEDTSADSNSHSIAPCRTGEPANGSHKEEDTGGLNLLNRDKHGGSAFELYKRSSTSPRPDNETPKAVALATCVPNNTDIAAGQVCSESPLTDRHSVFAEVRGLIGPEGGQLVSEETGVCLIIPPGAIASSTPECMFFKVCHDKNLMPPLDESRGETLLSPLVMCGPQGLQFAKPIELRLPQKDSPKTMEQWSFALKTCPDDSGKWQNVTLSELKATRCGTSNDKFVSVYIDRF